MKPAGQAGASLLSIAGLDPTGGAGLLADCAAFRLRGFEAATAVTAIASQHSGAFCELGPTGSRLLASQVRAVAWDHAVAGIKVGMLASGDQAEMLAGLLPELFPGRPVVVDPVVRSSSGGQLYADQAWTERIGPLFRLAALATPNIGEFSMLAGTPEIDSTGRLIEHGRRCADRYATRLLVKGGHAPFAPGVDWLFRPNAEPVRFDPARMIGDKVRGTGCWLSSLITAGLAAGLGMEQAVEAAKRDLERLASDCTRPSGTPGVRLIVPPPAVDTT